eukprot:gene7915-10709_t
MHHVVVGGGGGRHAARNLAARCGRGKGENGVVAGRRRANAPRRWRMKFSLWALVVIVVQVVAASAADVTPPIGQLTTPGWRYEELRRFKAPEAGQGVAVDKEFFYAITNHTIGKYRKATGERVAGWEGGKGGEVIHINAGF